MEALTGPVAVSKPAPRQAILSANLAWAGRQAKQPINRLALPVQAPHKCSSADILAWEVDKARLLAMLASARRNPGFAFWFWNFPTTIAPNSFASMLYCLSLILAESRNFRKSRVGRNSVPLSWGSSLMGSYWPALYRALMAACMGNRSPAPNRDCRYASQTWAC